MNTVQWLQGLQSFLNKLLEPILPDKTKRYKYLSPSAMKVWKTAFTHESIDPDDNYEDLEYLGDKVSGAQFAKYLRKRFPYYHKRHYTQLGSYYMAKIFNGEMARKMGLAPYIRVNTYSKGIFNIEADLFESFFGALDVIGDSIVDGIGDSVCYNMIVYLFNNVEIDERKAEEAPKTQVEQIFSRFDMDKPKTVFLDNKRAVSVRVEMTPRFSKILEVNKIKADKILGEYSESDQNKARNNAYEEAINNLIAYNLINVNEQVDYREDTENVEVKVVLNKDNLEFLREYDVNVTNPVIGVGIAPTKKEAEDSAFKHALDNLESYGVSSDWAFDLKTYIDFEEPNTAPYVPAAEARAHSEGYESIYFFLPRKLNTNRGDIVQLRGRIPGPEGRSRVLGTIATKDRSNSYAVAKAQLMHDYANNIN